MSLIQKDAPALASLAHDFAWGRRFIIWIGSGLSVQAGLVTWRQLRTRLETRLSAAAKRKLPDLTDQGRAEFVAQIRRIPDPWQAFEILKSRLGEVEYRQIITLALNDGEVPGPPKVLERIWSNPNVDGMISLNIDNLASRSFAAVNGGRRDLSRATGNSLKLGLRYLSSYQPFLVQLHGRLDDEQSWVFTETELSDLFARPDYKAFVRSALSARRVLFIGCSPDDVAVAKHFEELSRITESMPEHYWFVPSHEMDSARDVRIAQMGINIIEYDVDRTVPDLRQNQLHEDAIFELFDHVETYQYREAEPEPINPMAGPSGARLPPDRVQALAPEQARNLLSRYATSILEGPEDRRVSAYEEFLAEYGPAIAVASYVPKQGNSHVFGHEVTGILGEGAFSRVLKAVAPDGVTERAIKLVRNEVRDDPIMLRSFRRGVRSMQILSDKRVPGMVAYDQAYEIPPCVIMPFIDGQNLEDFGLRPDFSFLTHGLPALARVAEIVHSAHDLTERVLHRDLRPSNIMVRSGAERTDIEDRVVVLDFDLSWHEGADTDAPISPNMTTVLGYLAPEQVTNDVSISARHQRVDTYGLCMTMYYLLQKQHPDFRLRGGGEWMSVRDRLARNLISQVNWRSFISRVRRLVHLGTEPEQESRLDFDVMMRELRLLNSLKNLRLENISSAQAEWMALETLAEEVLARALDIENYEWRPRFGSGRHEGVLGIAIEVNVEEWRGEPGIKIVARKQFDGRQSFATVRKYWMERKRQIQQIMNSGGWEDGGASSLTPQVISLSFFAPESVAWGDPLKLARTLAESWRRLNIV